MSAAPFAWDAWVDDVATPWFYVQVPTPAEGALWLSAMFAAFEAVAERFDLPPAALIRLVQAASRAMVLLPCGVSAHEEMVRSVDAAVKELDRILAFTR